MLKRVKISQPKIYAVRQICFHNREVKCRNEYIFPKRISECLNRLSF